MWAARGYSVGVTGVRTHALYLAEAKLAMSPFDDAVRLAGVLELGTPSRMTAARFVGGAKPYLVGEPVAGGDLRPRACGPDTQRRPADRVSLAPGLVVATGHGMLGVTLAPATAMRVASLL